jgi:hypothetical protein
MSETKNLSFGSKTQVNKKREEFESGKYNLIIGNGE